MATVINPMIEPETSAIKSHLVALFERVRTDYPDGLIELRHGQDGKINRSAYFGIVENEISEAVAYAVTMNREGQNVYVGVNPRKSNVNRKGSANDTDVEIAFFQFADLDKKEAVENARGDLPLKPSLVVITGTIPNNRPHLYWELEEPVHNLAAWTDRQRGIAQALGGDAVINPSRIMRLAGTVNWPTQDKIGRGYKVEVCTFKSEFADERAPVSPEQVAFAYPPPQFQSNDKVVMLPGDGQNTLQAMRSTRTADLMAACRSGEQWHNNMVRLVAHLAAKGRADAEILGLASGLTLPGYSVDQTVREMVAALQSARVKWDLPEPKDDIESEERARDDGDSVFPLFTVDDLEDIHPPEFLIDELLTEQGLAILYGAPGSGKSFIALDMALRIAYGMEWHGKATQRTGVLYIAGEGHVGLAKRVKGWRFEHAMEGASCPFLLLPVAVQMMEPKDVQKLIRTIVAGMELVGEPVGLVIIDTVSRALTGADENTQETMSGFVHACGEIQNYIGGACLGIHHTGKEIARGMRGSSVLIGACDTSIKCEGNIKEDQRVTITVEKQKDSEEIDPISFTMKEVNLKYGLGKDVNTLVPVISECAPDEPESELSKHQIGQIFDEIARGWLAGSPWSIHAQTRKEGRYLPEWINQKFSTKQSTAIHFLSAWQMNGLLTYDICDGKSKKKGLKVIRRLDNV